MILVYTKPDCKYCVMAKNLLKEKGLQYIENELGKDLTREEFISLYPTQKTLPLIFDGHDKIGGFDQLKEYLK